MVYNSRHEYACNCVHLVLSHNQSILICVEVLTYISTDVLCTGEGVQASNMQGSVVELVIKLII